MCGIYIVSYCSYVSVELLKTADFIQDFCSVWENYGHKCTYKTVCFPVENTEFKSTSRTTQCDVTDVVNATNL